MLRVLVFGASGFIGGHLMRHLRQSGALVFPAGHARLPEGGLRCDITDAASVDEAFRASKPDVVFQLAGTCAATDARTHYLVHTAGAVNLLESASRLAPGAALLFAGSSAEYGAARDESLPLRETQEARPSSFYGAAKLAQTMAVLVGAGNLGLKAAVLRPFNIIGPGLPAHYFLGALAEQLLQRRKNGDFGPFAVHNAASTRDYLDVRDAAQALWLLGQHVLGNGPDAQIYNLCSGREVPILQPARRLGLMIGSFQPVDAGLGAGRSGIARSVGCPDKLVAAIGWRPERGWEQSVDDFYAELVNSVQRAPEAG